VGVESAAQFSADLSKPRVGGLFAIAPWMESSLALTDAGIVRQILAGETQIFELVVRRYSQRLYRAARAILRTNEDAEDAVQQAFLNAYRHIDRFQGRAALSTWLTRIVVYEALAKRRRSRPNLTDSIDQRMSDLLFCDQLDPERQAYVGELNAVLQSAVDALPEGQRAVFTLREINGLSTAQAAHQLCVSEGAVKARLHRAKGELRQTLCGSRSIAYRKSQQQRG